MSKIWLVSRGEYSDYHVICAFSTPQKAVSYSRAAKDSFIETLSLDEDMPETAECIHVLMDKSGDAVSIYGPHIYDRNEIGFSTYSCFPPNSDMCLSWRVETGSEERAIKVVNEKRAQIIAAGIWGDSLSTIERFG